ncbi:MAG: hypothetical protein IJI85_10315 [Clostridia bacterium]|nr:hypothetical protein [Lentisphaeria bacterium]MBR0422953.1 hypothetical protein [Clostridia bacterium]
MSVQFGIVTTADGIGAVILQSTGKTDSIQTSEAMNEHGKVIAINGYGRKTGGSFSFLLDGEVTAKAGDVITVGEESKIITNININETNTSYAEGSADYDGAPGVIPEGPIDGASN